MARKNQIKTTAPKSQEEAEKIARGIQKPGQRKEQTKLIAQGIQKGIDLYKKEQNAKLRDADKKRKQALKQQAQDLKSNPEPGLKIERKQHWLPWSLLVLSWIGFGVYLIQNSVLK